MIKWKMQGKDAALCQPIKGIVLSVDKSAVGDNYFWSALGVRSEAKYPSREKAMEGCESHVLVTLNKLLAMIQE